MSARIFISHSSKGPGVDDGIGHPLAEEDDQALLPYARRVRDLTTQKLKDREFEVWLDQTALRPGDDWRAVLHRWLGTCDGAVILLDQHSLRSAWLLKEATILAWRRDIGADIRVVPVLLGDCTPEDVQASPLAPLELPISQAARVPTHDRTGAAADKLATQIAVAFAGLTRQTPQTDMERWIKDVRQLLAQVERPYLEDAAQALDITEDQWFAAGDATSDGDLSATLAHTLLYSSLDKALSAFERMVGGVNPDRLVRLAELVQPAWVDVGAARSLNAIVGLPQSRIAVLAAMDPETGRDYIRRARHSRIFPNQIITAMLPTGTATVSEGLARFQAGVCSQIGGSWPEHRDRVEAYLRKETVERFAVLGPETLRPELLTCLRDSYARVRFIVLGERGTVEQLADRVDGAVVNPPLAPGKEDDARVDVGNIYEILRPTP